MWLDSFEDRLEAVKLLCSQGTSDSHQVVYSIDWFKGKVTGNSHISWENPWFPVDFLMKSQPINLWSKNAAPLWNWEQEHSFKNDFKGPSRKWSEYLIFKEPGDGGDLLRFWSAAGCFWFPSPGWWTRIYDICADVYTMVKTWFVFSKRGDGQPQMYIGLKWFECYSLCIV